VNFIFQLPSMFIFLISRKSGLLKVVYTLKIVTIQHMVPHWLAQVLHSPQQFEDPTITTFEETQIELVGMSMIFHCTKLCLSKCNGSWFLPIKQTVNFNVQLPTMFVFLFSLSAQVVLLKAVYPLKICQHTTYHGPTLTGASFAYTSVVWKSNHHHIQKVH
jgi:hypothetical protein